MIGQMNEKLEYLNVSMLVRPAKVAILFPKMDCYWKHTIPNVFEWCSRVWGGAYFLIIPTDGVEIKNPFWQILEEYNPDHIFSFTPSIQDLELADPPKYHEIVDNYRAHFFKQFPELSEEEFLKVFKRDLRPKPLMNFQIEAKLQQKLKQRLAPFYFEEYIVQNHISSNDYVPFPLTQLEHIAKIGNLKQVYVFDGFEDPNCGLVFYSNWGIYSKSFEEELINNEIEVIHIPQTANYTDLLKISINKRVDSFDYTLRKTLNEKIGDTPNLWVPPDNLALLSPYESSLLKVGKYKTSDSISAYESKTVIIGDSLDDFCLYYCLSRFQNAAYWIPGVHLNNTKEEGTKQKDKNILAKIITNEIGLRDPHHNTNGRFKLSSMSLSREEQQQVKDEIVQLYYLDQDEFANRIELTSLDSLLQKPITRLIELNNYSNQYTEVFKNKHGVGRLPTPRPKNFTQVLPYNHRWITEFTIEGYIPPQLHFLGKEIVDLNGTTEVRVSNSGICYNCPNIGFFGGDIDVTLVKPQIRIIEPLEIFQKYFFEAGFSDVRLSDKGNYTQETIQKFGSLNELGNFLKSIQNQRLLARFRSRKSSNDINTGEVAYVNNRAYIDFRAISQEIGSEKQAIQLLDMLLQKSIFYRGLVLQCTHCRASDWYGIEELDQHFVCRRCRHPQTILQRNWKRGNEPAWFYKLDEVIYQGLSNNMVLPLLTIVNLMKNSKKSFLYTPELECRKDKDSVKPDREVDICCIQDGRIIIGECSITNISKELVNKLSKFSHELMRSPEMLVYSTLNSSVSEDIKMYAKSTLQFPFLFLTESDLVIEDLLLG
jgi:hypothetical protein